jgi:NADH-quinone oxidoreductase subunit L
VEVAAVIVCALPLCAAVANGVNALSGDRLYGHVAVTRIAVTAVTVAFAASLYVAAAMVVQPGPREVTVYRFLESGDLSVEFGFLLDPLSVLMMLVVTGISALVTHFSVNYMHNEDGFTRYFTVMSLFVFAMLVLVMADNYLVMFLGWEGVGVCSYLLISFYQERPASARAGTKAFVMNRVGDAELLIAMFVLVAYTGSLQYGEVFAEVSSLPRGTVEAVGFLLLFGAVGKSAQLPLGTWLARAMEGPTPSSALMHAATMVTAGVYLVVRSAPIYDQAATALLAVGIVGALTALYGQLVGYVQTDIKGLLAASTTAQLGLMFLFCGLGLYAVAIFHLVAHAFYKSYLFLTAPSILHQLHGGPDPTAVRRPEDTARLPAVVILAVATGLVALPLIGRVLEPVGGVGGLTANAWVVLALAVIAIFTGVFSTRRMTVVAFADHTDKGSGPPDPHADEASSTRTARLIKPLLVLAGLVALGLVLDVLPGGLTGSWFQRLLSPAVDGNVGVPLGNPLVAVLLTGAIALLLLSGWYSPRYLDRYRDELPPAAVPATARRLYWWSLNRGYLDDVYGRRVVAPATALGRALDRFDSAVFDRQLSLATWAEPTRPATWEERFRALRDERGAGVTALAEPPDRLDWLQEAQTAGVVAGRAQRIARLVAGPSGGGGAVGGVMEAGARLAEGIERVVFQRSGGRGVLTAVADGLAGLAERLEQHVFQPLDTGVSKMTGIIARITNAVELTVFQRGVERAVSNAAAGSQRRLLTFEQRLGRLPVIGGILALSLLVLIVGTR